MIYPSRALILLTAAVAPIALAIGLFLPAYWQSGLALIVLLLALAAVDALSGASAARVRMACEGPGAVGVGERLSLDVHLEFQGASPSRVQVVPGLVGEAERLDTAGAVAVEEGRAATSFAYRPTRRGTLRVESIWARWKGPIGLVWKQRQVAVDRTILVTPNIGALQGQAFQLLSRDAIHGLVAQLQVGEGAEFEALTEFRPGMDRRAIDWKQSARHSTLIAKEFRTERNNQIVMAVDHGRSMAEPVGGLARVDRAVSAALLTSFMALKGGDRVGLFAFDNQPRLSTQPVGGPKAFGLLQRAAAEIDYSANEPNYTLALSTLASRLRRRSLIILFTEFADTISAELMLAAVGQILKRHLVLFLVFRDEELEAFVEREPEEAEDVSRAVTAAALLRERQLVLTRLRHMGVHVVEAAADEAGPALLDAYLVLKRRSLL